MNVFDAISTRRTIKRFKNQTVDREQVENWLQTAALAPNHRLTEPWEILWVGPKTRAEVGHKTDFGGAPVLLAVLSTPAKTKIDRDEHLAAVACFIQNFMLLALSEGIGTGWSSIGASPKVQKLLDLQPDYDVVGFLSVGYPEQVPEPKLRTPIQQKMRDLP